MINKLKLKSEFSKNVLTLMTGTTIAQAIPIAISPILTRIYTPEDFGLYALFVAIISTIGTIANGRYELAIMLPKKDEDAINIVALGFIITCVISLFFLVLVIFFNDYFVSLLNNSEIGLWLYFVPISVFLIGIWNILNYFNNRKKNYKDIRNATIIKSIITAIIQLSIGFLKQGATGLISGQIVSQFFANTKLLKNILKDKILLAKISKPKIIALAKRYKDFPKINMLSTLSNVITTNLPFFMLPKLFDLSTVGHFSLAQKLVFLPSTLISTSISQVFFQKTSENITNKKQNMPLLFQTIKKLFFISLPIAIFIFLLSPYLFEIIFGKEWKISGEIAQYLSLIFFIAFIISPISISLIAYKKLKILAIYQYSFLFFHLLFFIFSIYSSFPLKDFLLFYVILQYLLYITYFFSIFIIVYSEDKKMFEEIISC